MDKIASNSNSMFAGSAGFSLSGSQFSRNKPKFGFQKFLIFTVGESRAHELASGMAKSQMFTERGGNLSTSVAGK